MPPKKRIDYDHLAAVVNASESVDEAAEKLGVSRSMLYGRIGNARKLGYRVKLFHRKWDAERLAEFVECYNGSNTDEDVADVLGMSVANVKAVKFRARQQGHTLTEHKLTGPDYAFLAGIYAASGRISETNGCPRLRLTVLDCQTAQWLTRNFGGHIEGNGKTHRVTIANQENIERIQRTIEKYRK